MMVKGSRHTWTNPLGVNGVEIVDGIPGRQVPVVVGNITNVGGTHVAIRVDNGAELILPMDVASQLSVNLQRSIYAKYVADGAT